jgi:hypothetical protein
VEEQGAYSINTSEMINIEVSSGVPKELRQDACSIEQKHEMKESSTTPDEVSQFIFIVTFSCKVEMISRQFDLQVVYLLTPIINHV